MLAIFSPSKKNHNNDESNRICWLRCCWNRHPRLVGFFGLCARAKVLGSGIGGGFFFCPEKYACQSIMSAWKKIEYIYIDTIIGILMYLFKFVKFRWLDSFPSQAGWKYVIFFIEPWWSTGIKSLRKVAGFKIFVAIEGLPSINCLS